MITNYQKEYPSKISQTRVISEKEAFNIEKEHKIINPHPMELSTTNKVVYQPFQVKPSKKEQKRVEKSEAPCLQHSHYAAEFPNWMNG